MAIIEELTETSPVDLNDYIETSKLEPLGVPDAALINRAASAALLTDSPEQTYRSVLVEAEQGQTYTLDNVKKKAEVENRPQDMKTILSILGDTSLDEATRMSAIKAINSDFIKDTTTQLVTKAASQPSPSVNGVESKEQEEVRLVGMEEQLRPVFEYRNLRQNLVNSQEVYKDEITAKKVAGFFAYLAPFSTNVNAERSLFDLAKIVEEDPSRAAAFFASGSFAKDLNETITNLPPDKRMEVVERLYEVLDKKSGVWFGSDNDFNKWITHNSVLTEEGYSNLDMVIDNISLPLDILSFGGFSAARGLITRGVKAAEPTTKAWKAAKAADTVRFAYQPRVIPAAPANVIAEANPDKARQLYALTVKSSDEFATGAYGVPKEEALIAGVVPKIASADGSVTAAVPEINRVVEKTIVPDEKAFRVYDSDGALYYFPEEKAAAEAKVINDVRNATGLTYNEAASSIGWDGKGVIKAVYGGSEGGFLNANDLVKQAKFALKEYGITDQNITLLKKENGEYVPTKLDEVGDKPGDYQVQLDFDKPLLPKDIDDLTKLDVKRNFFARLPFSFSGLFGQKQGSLQRTLVDIGSMFQKEVAGAAVALIDKSVALDKALLHPFDRFSKQFKGLATDRQQVLWEHMIEANHKGLELSDAALIAQDFSKAEIDTLKQWRKSWDNHFWFENNSLVRTLQVQGWNLFESDKFKHVVKRVEKNKNIRRAYDPSVDRVVDVTDVDQLYETNGYLAKIRRPVDVDDEIVEHMIVRNTPSEYARALNPGDQLLNYRPGYFQIRYTAPRFLEREIKDASGNKFRKVVAYGASTEDLERYRERMARAEGIAPEEYGTIRGDIHEAGVDSDVFWDLNSASGRIATRHRGKLLEDANGPVNVSQTPYILNPVDSAIRASRSLSEHVMMRPYIESLKQRAIKQWGRYFKGADKGMPEWPSSAKDLIIRGNAFSKETAQVRSIVEYVNYLEGGYVNSLDDGYKSLMNSMANMMDDLGTSKGERLFNWMSHARPTSAGKNLVFNAYIGTFFNRQWIVQTHGFARMAAYNPDGMVRVLARAEPMKYALAKSYEFLGKPIPKEWRELQEFIDDAGILSAVDRSNLVRGNLASLTEAQHASVRTAGKALSIPRQIGFDKAEQFNLLSHLLVVRDKFIQQGKDVTKKAVRDEIVATTRAITGNMNFAGDFPYNQNWAGLFMQFLQVPHKAFLMVTNRTIPFWDRMKLAFADLMMFGVPGGRVLSDMIPQDMLPEDSTLRTTLEESLLFDIYNGYLTKLAGKDVKIDFSPLSPYGIDGLGKLAYATWTQGWEGMINSAPIAGIAFKEDNRIKEALVRLSRYTGFYDPYKGVPKETLSSVVDGFLSISSGWTNWQKAKALDMLGKSYDKKGRLMKDDAHQMYVWAQAFGFSSYEESQRWKVIMERQEGTKEFREDVQKTYNAYIKAVTRQTGKPIVDDEVHIMMLGIVKDLYKDSPEATRMFMENLRRDLADPNLQLYKDAMRYARIAGTREKMKEHERFFKTDEEKRKVGQLVDDIYREANKED